MRLLAVDPGETCGFATFEVHVHTPIAPSAPPVLLEEWEEPGLPLGEFALRFLHTLQTEQPKIVVIENYRIFESKAQAHIGRTLATANLIGAIVALCAVVAPPVATALVDPTQKGRWPSARLEVKFPDCVGVPDSHALDAIKIGLVFAERRLGWTP